MVINHFRNVPLTNHHHPQPASSPTFTTTDFYDTGFDGGAAFPSTSVYSTDMYSPPFRDAAFRYASKGYICQC